jgi:hypothetical protein
MKESNVKTQEVQIDMDQQLEPTVLAPISEVTGSAPGGSGDSYDQVVWGNE